MSIQEFGTIMEHQIPVKMILLNNTFLGNVRQWQDLMFGHRHSFTEMMNPRYGDIARGYGIAYDLLLIEKSSKQRLTRCFLQLVLIFLNVPLSPMKTLFP